MVKRKKTASSKNDTKVAAIVLGLFVAVIILFSIFSKSQESHKVKVPAVKEGTDEYIPNENIKPVEVLPPAPVKTPSPILNLSGSGGKIAFIIDDWGQSYVSDSYSIFRDSLNSLAKLVLLTF